MLLLAHTCLCEGLCIGKVVVVVVEVVVEGGGLN